MNDGTKVKRWKEMYLRSEKLHRAAQLGMEYPRVTEDDHQRATYGDEKLHVLFVCSRNQWRSPTAEQVFRKYPGLSVRSAGTSTGARHAIHADDVAWADVIMVMEDKHKSRLKSEFARLLPSKSIFVLDIPDEYKYMAPALVAELEERVPALLATLPDHA
jgi:predicted protein tyrosine phosphatase